MGEKPYMSPTAYQCGQHLLIAAIPFSALALRPAARLRVAVGWSRAGE